VLLVGTAKTLGLLTAISQFLYDDAEEFFSAISLLSSQPIQCCFKGSKRNS
jgi:hypothetical protein